MATYIVLGNWTDAGVRDFKQTVERAETADRMLQAWGGRMVSIHWTLGPYDFVVLAESPDDATTEAWLVAVGAKGNVTTTTMRAFDRSEMQTIVDKASSA
jgi:uncharacterized protein with GYD domain